MSEAQRKAAKENKLNLTEKPDFVQWPPTHFVFIEKIGPFMETAYPAWQELLALVPEIAKHSKISGHLSLYKIEPQMIYRAGVAVDGKPAHLAKGLQYMKFEGGKYSRFTLTGPYSNLPQACGRVFEIVKQTKTPVRDAFNIEHYLNDPKTTPEDQLITEILVPTQ